VYCGIEKNINFQIEFSYSGRTESGAAFRVLPELREALQRHPVSGEAPRPRAAHPVALRHHRRVHLPVPVLLPVPGQASQEGPERARQCPRRDPAPQAEPRRVERAQRPQRPTRPRLQVQHQQAAGGAQARHAVTNHRQRRHRPVAVLQVRAGPTSGAGERPVCAELPLQDARLLQLGGPSQAQLALRRLLPGHQYHEVRRVGHPQAAAHRQSALVHHHHLLLCRLCLLDDATLRGRH